jgi:hypothetical protein
MKNIEIPFSSTLKTFCCKFYLEELVHLYFFNVKNWNPHSLEL